MRLILSLYLYLPDNSSRMKRTLVWLFISFIISTTIVFVTLTYHWQGALPIPRATVTEDAVPAIPGVIALLIAATTRKITSPSLETLALTTRCIPSLKATVEPGFIYRVYIGTEYDDYLVSQFATLRTLSSSNFEIIPVTVAEGGTLNKVLNAIALRAYNEGAEYMSHITDDTRFLTKNWTSFAIMTLNNYIPKNIGVVGPTFREGNTEVMTHSMVHRSHFDIFKFYFPPIFDNWYEDDWITFVYSPLRSRKLQTWEIQHTLEHGTRYNIDYSKKKWLMPMLSLCRLVIKTIIKEATFKPTLRVISYSLFNSLPQHTDGALKNAKLASQIFPGWIVRVYHDGTVPSHVVDSLAQRNVQLVNISAYTSKIPYYLYKTVVLKGVKAPVIDKTAWNLFVAFDPTVERYIIRNADSKLTWRERPAVDQWIASGKWFHIMRNHSFHSNEIVPIGMWGGTHNAVPDIINLLHQYNTARNYSNLEDFLNKEIIKLATKSVIVT